MNVLAIDQGTSATKALLVGPGGEVLGRGEVPVRTRSVGEAGVEADPEELLESVLAAVLGAVITLVLRTHAAALATLFTASTIMPALLYSGTVLLYVFTSRRGAGRAREEHHRSFGKMQIPVIAGAVIWLCYELIILIGPSAFRDAQYYVLGSLGLGLVFYVVQLVTEPRAMRTEPGQE